MWSWKWRSVSSFYTHPLSFQLLLHFRIFIAYQVKILTYLAVAESKICNKRRTDTISQSDLFKMLSTSKYLSMLVFLDHNCEESREFQVLIRVSREKPLCRMIFVYYILNVSLSHVSNE